MSLNVNSNNTGLFNTSKNNNMANLTATVLGASGSSLLGDSSMSSLTKTVLGSGNGSSLLSDYASIKDGSYGKLLKAYYAEKKAIAKAESEKEELSKTENNSNTDTDTDKSAKTDTLSSFFDTYI